MSITPPTDLHRRRASRNYGLAAALLAFVAIVFGLTVAKMQTGAPMEAFDHTPRATLLPPEPGS